MTCVGTCGRKSWGYGWLWKFQVRAAAVTPDHPDEALGAHLAQGTRGKPVSLRFWLVLRWSTHPSPNLPSESPGLEAQFSEQVHLIGMG